MTIGFDEAQRLLEDAAAPIGIESVALGAAHRRILAETLVAATASPPADTSSMDGYAVREADLASLPASLRVIGESLPGKGHDAALRGGECVRIFTGAPLPQGADRVMMQEVVERDGEQARIGSPLPVSSFIRRAGSDFEEGDVLLERGTLLTPGALVAAAAADRAALDVFRRPRLALITTGDELAEPGSAHRTAGAIPDSIGVAVAALAADWGAEVVAAARVRDDLGALKSAARTMLETADIIVVTGGASVGEKDHARAMFADEGIALIFSKVAIKPGRPVWFGRAGGRLVLGLPGNPTSALVTARLFLAPLLCALGGRDARDALAWRAMPSGDALDPAGGRETFSRGVAEGGFVRLLESQDSGSQKTLAAARLLVRRTPGGARIAAGGFVDVLDF